MSVTDRGEAPSSQMPSRSGPVTAFRLFSARYNRVNSPLTSSHKVHNRSVRSLAPPSLQTSSVTTEHLLQYLLQWCVTSTVTVRTIRDGHLDFPQLLSSAAAPAVPTVQDNRQPQASILACGDSDEEAFQSSNPDSLKCTAAAAVVQRIRVSIKFQ